MRQTRKPWDYRARRGKSLTGARKATQVVREREEGGRDRGRDREKSDRQSDVEQACSLFVF